MVVPLYESSPISSPQQLSRKLLENEDLKQLFVLILDE